MKKLNMIQIEFFDLKSSTLLISNPYIRQTNVTNIHIQHTDKHPLQHTLQQYVTTYATTIRYNIHIQHTDKHTLNKHFHIKTGLENVPSKRIFKNLIPPKPRGLEKRKFIWLHTKVRVHQVLSKSLMVGYES